MPTRCFRPSSITLPTLTGRSICRSYINSGARFCFALIPIKDGLGPSTHYCRLVLSILTAGFPCSKRRWMNIFPAQRQPKQKTPLPASPTPFKTVFIWSDRNLCQTSGRIYGDGFSCAQIIAEGEKRTGHASGNQSHDHQHGKNARRKNSQIISDVKSDQFH